MVKEPHPIGSDILIISGDQASSKPIVGGGREDVGSIKGYPGGMSLATQSACTGQWHHTTGGLFRNGEA